VEANCDLDNGDGVDCTSTQQKPGACLPVPDTTCSCQHNVETEGIALIVSLRANSSIPYNVISHIVTCFNDMSGSTVMACKAEVLNCISACKTEDGALDELSFFRQLGQKLQKFSEPLDFLSSRHKLDTFFSSHKLFVPPKTVCFKMRFETNCGNTKAAYDAFQYVSVEGTLKSLLSNDQFSCSLYQFQTQIKHRDVIAHFSDGQKAKQNKVNHDSSTGLNIDIQLFYDGMGTTNPLRGQSAM